LPLMIVRVPDIPKEGLSVTEVGALGPVFRDPTWRLERVELRLERDGAEVFVTGEIGAGGSQAGGRGLWPGPVPVPPRLTGRSAADSVELAADDLDVDFYDKDEIDVGVLIETETTLALPMKPLCREGCLGLCPVCGGNRNLVQCDCQQRAPDPRLAALKDLAARFPR